MVPFQTIRSEGIDCKFKRLNGYLFPLTDSTEHIGMIDKELVAARRAGLTDVTKVNQPPILRSDVSHAHVMSCLAECKPVLKGRYQACWAASYI